MIIFRNIIVMLLWISCLEAYSQNQLPDSIQLKLNSISTDTAKVTELLKFSRKFSRSNTELNELILSYARKLALASDDLRTISRVKILIGQLLLSKNQFDSAQLLYSQALASYQQLGDSANIGVALFELGTLQYYQENDSVALHYYIQTANIFEALGDEKRLSFVYNNLANVYRYLYDYELAIMYTEKAIVLKKKFAIENALGSSYHNLGGLYNQTGNIQLALKNFRISMSYKNRFNDLKGLATTYNSLAEIYYKQKFSDSSIYYHQKAISIDIELADSIALANDQQSLAHTYYLLGKYEEAIVMAEAAKNNTKSARTREKSISIIAQSNSKLENYESASIYYEAYILLHDSLTNSARTKAVDELKTKYETEKKEQQIANLEQENRIKQIETDQQRQLKLFLIVGAVLLFIAIGLLYNRNRVKSKSNALLDAKNKELQQLNYTKDRLFSIISHDLRSPLSSFYTITRSLTDNWENIEKEQLKGFIESLRDSSKEVHDMMDNLLRWALAQAGQLNYKPENINPATAVNEVKKQLILPLQANKIELNVNMDDITSLKVDNDYLKLILRNLVSNAIKFSEMDSTIEVLAEENDMYKIISIRDNGVGIRKEDLSKLFGDTAAVHEINNSTNKGTGLGLTLCKELIEKMGGSIEVESEFGKGSTFKLLFPKAV